MNWNYRVFREADGGLSIREVFYEQDGTILACGEPAPMEADSISELAELLGDLRAALALPLLTLNDVPSSTETPKTRPERQRLSHQAVLAELGLEREAEQA
jgi:hypothetical protein